MSLVDVERFMFLFCLIRVDSWIWGHELASEGSVELTSTFRVRNRWNKPRYTFWSVLSKAKILNLNISYAYLCFSYLIRSSKFLRISLTLPQPKFSFWEIFFFFFSFFSLLVQKKVFAVCAVGAIHQAHQLVAKYPLVQWPCSHSSILAALELDCGMKPVWAQKQTPTSLRNCF